MSFPVVFPAIRTAVFDIGGVLFTPHLVNDFYPRWAKQLGVEPERLRELIWIGSDIEAANVGAITAEEYCRRCAVRLGSDEMMILALIEDLFSGEHLNEELATYIGTLKPCIQVVALTNNWSFGRRLIERRGITGLFDLIILSAEEGVKKPHLRIYEIMLERLRIQPEEIVFVDDVGENVEAARVLGIHGIQFCSNEQTISELKALLSQHKAE
jgi:putative hydrolase of the HAD superfamily